MSRPEFQEFIDQLEAKKEDAALRRILALRAAEDVTEARELMASLEPKSFLFGVFMASVIINEGLTLNQEKAPATWATVNAFLGFLTAVYHGREAEDAPVPEV